jgi:aminomethyltransferase
MTKRTPLFAKHLELHATMMPFGGWEMPLRYSSERAEHMAVRTAMGLFDVSHMGEILLEGDNACALADRLLTNDVRGANVGRALYACMLNGQGGIIDDLVVYKLAPNSILLCVNASNIDKDFAWVKHVAQTEFDARTVQVTNASERYAQLALQGPKSSAFLKRLLGGAIAAIPHYSFINYLLPLPGSPPSIIARTGYTGEDGFEIFIAPDHVIPLWDLLLREGRDEGLVPAGLSARDTLRLEAGMCLYGNDIDDATSPLEAGLAWTVHFGKLGGFVGEDALLAQKRNGLLRRLVGLELLERGIARHGYIITTQSGEALGAVTSGTFAPFLEKAIAMGYVRAPYHQAGTNLRIIVRDQALATHVVKLPFYKKK